MNFQGSVLNIGGGDDEESALCNKQNSSIEIEQSDD
jgi:hypothetical protein